MGFEGAAAHSSMVSSETKSFDWSLHFWRWTVRRAFLALDVRARASMGAGACEASVAFNTGLQMDIH